MSLLMSIEMITRASGKRVSEGWSIAVHSGQLQVRQAVVIPTGR